MTEQTTSSQLSTASGNGSRPTPHQVDDALRVLDKVDFDGAQIIRARQASKFREEPEPSDCPPLPRGVRLDAAHDEEADAWVDLYISHATAISPMTPRHFHESAALWLASVAIARRLVLKMPYDDIYPNLFIVWIAKTTLYRKSTALNVAVRLARRVFPHLLAAQDTTPEAFLSDLAGREPSKFDALTQQEKEEWRTGRNYAAQKGWVRDEMSGLLAASGRDYNAGLTEALLQCYDCCPHFARSTRGQGRVVVQNAYLSMIGASTPEAMYSHLMAERLWGMGWWPRFAILTPDAVQPDWRTAQVQDEPPELVEGLRRLYDQLPAATWPDPPQAKTVQLDGEVYDAWERYNKAMGFDLLTTAEIDPRLHGTYGRLPTQALKVATILAAFDWERGGSNAPTIRLTHLARAISVCEEWRASAHRVLTVAMASEFDRLRARILRRIGRAGPEGATVRDIYKSIKHKEPSMIENAVKQMVALGELEENEAKPGKSGGKPTKRYTIATE